MDATLARLDAGGRCPAAAVRAGAVLGGLQRRPAAGLAENRGALWSGVAFITSLIEAAASYVLVVSIARSTLTLDLLRSRLL